ncbi:PREDICTED: sphingosine 1-phosphate receptor 2, partial [Corvus brachyrhynchos]|uniref:sphingosine 1-phosphate receptor 2 n=1 Tax=Corvus brachyrhynchos TaxID=85066 RepID=UPI00081636BD
MGFLSPTILVSPPATPVSSQCPSRSPSAIPNGISVPSHPGVPSCHPGVPPATPVSPQVSPPFSHRHPHIPTLPLVHPAGLWPEPCPGGADPRRRARPGLTMGSIYKEYFNRDKIREHYNYTKGDGDASAPSRSVGSVLIVILCCFIVLENLLVLVSICRNKRLHLAMYIFIGNLAASDLLAGTAFMVNTLLSGSTTFSLTPVQWFVREGTAVATLGASLPIMGWNCISDLGDCSTVLPLYSKRYVLFVTTIFTLILLAIVGLYTRIYCIVRSSHAEIASAQTLALLKTVTIVLGAFIVCWLPAFIILLMDASCPVRACRVLYKANYFFAFATLNSAANPVIYTLRSK